MARDLQVPTAKTALLTEENANPSNPSKPWFSFWELIGKRLSALGSVSTVTTPDATDLASVITLANALKAKQNDIINSQQ